MTILYVWQKRKAAPVLRPGGSVLACFGIGFLPETLAALGAALRYRWTCYACGAAMTVVVSCGHVRDVYPVAESSKLTVASVPEQEW